MTHERLDAAIDDTSIAPFESTEIDEGTPHEPVKRSSTLRHALVLGTLTALGALGIDTYLPAFPSIAESFGVNEGEVQLSLVSYFVALAVGQMVYGPVSDRIGRRKPLLFGFTLFIIASIGSAFSRNIHMLIAMRFVQGIGACAGMVIPRAIVRDLRSGEDAARLFALMLLVLGVSPILAPMLGSILLRWLPWQAAFWFLAIFGIACLAMIVTLLEETNPPERRTGGGVGMAFRNYGKLLMDRWFVITVLVGGFSQAVVFAYLAGSPFIYITLNHVAPAVYSLLFAMNAAGLIGLAQGNVALIRKLGASRLILMASAVQATAACCLLASTLLHIDSVPVIAICLFFCIGSQGLLGPTTAMLSLEPHPKTAGAASALMGALQFTCGAVSSSLVSVFFNGTSVPFAAVIAGCALAGLTLAALRASQAVAASKAAAPAGHAGD